MHKSTTEVRQATGKSIVASKQMRSGLIQAFSNLHLNPVVVLRDGSEHGQTYYSKCLTLPLGGGDNAVLLAEKTENVVGGRTEKSPGAGCGWKKRALENELRMTAIMRPENGSHHGFLPGGGRSPPLVSKNPPQKVRKTPPLLLYFGGGGASAGPPSFRSIPTLPPALTEETKPTSATHPSFFSKKGAVRFQKGAGLLEARGFVFL